MTRRVLEICVDDLSGVHAAIAGGADRIELCAALPLGGLTPSAAFVARALAAARQAGVKLHAMIRPRAGDFDYSADDHALAREEALTMLSLGVDGLVFGATQDGALDGTALKCWASEVRRAAPRAALTLHRAIDVVRDPVAAAGLAAELGFDTILTSGGAASAIRGVATIARMIATAGPRVTVMAGAGIRPENVAALLAGANVVAVHASAGRTLAPADPDVARLGFDTPPRRATDPMIVAALRTELDRPRQGDRP